MAKKTKVVRAPVEDEFHKELIEKAERIGIALAEVIRRKLSEWLQEPDDYIIRKK